MANNPTIPSASERPTLFFLHFLGGSTAAWREVTEPLRGAFTCIAIDLPGFGARSDASAYSVASMADDIADAVKTLQPRAWGLVGHSMGAKVAVAVARRAETGESGLAGLLGLALLAGSPPSPEPMDEAKRRDMLSWFQGDAETSRGQAEGYLADNIAKPIDPPIFQRMVGEVLKASPSAWSAWLEHGSREDWSDRIGVLQTPVLIVAGAEDAALGPRAQATLMSHHFSHARLVALPDTGHLLPLERPTEVSGLIMEHFTRVAGLAPPLDPAYAALIRSDRVSARTREVLLERARPDDAVYDPTSMTVHALSILRAVLDRVLPQGETGWIDLAARIDRQLSAGGDGWRFADLPGDPAAYRLGLSTLEAAAEHLHGCGFAELDAGHQDELLRQAAQGRLEVTAGEDRLTASQVKLWFEDLRAVSVKIYVAHPATLSRMGYSGIAYGGDGEAKSGFVRVGAGETEAWEPVAKAERTS